MLGLDDILGMCECTEEEIAAVALHEHVPDAIAAELADYIIHCSDGIPKMRKIIIDDIDDARRRGDMEQAKQLNEVLKHFVANHPLYLEKKSA